MSEEEAQLRSIEDGGTLRRLENGFEIIRRRKHEPIGALSGLSAEQTDKISGSKFAPEWTLKQYVQWLELFLENEKCEIAPGKPGRQIVDSDRVTGVSRGESTNRVCILSDGRYVHAYPVP